MARAASKNIVDASRLNGAEKCAVILLALLIVTVNLVVDLVVGFIDPRIRAA